MQKDSTLDTKQHKMTHATTILIIM